MYEDLGYLGFVVVYNLLATDYKDSRIEEIENNIINTLHGMVKEKPWSQDNLIFSFPRDPSVKTAKIPVIVQADIPTVFVEDFSESLKIAKAIKMNLKKTVFSKRGNVCVKIQATYAQKYS